MFASREDAGRRLGEWLLRRSVAPELVLGLPRGGVVVAAEVARLLRVRLGVLTVRKIGHPLFREFALGAMAEGGVVVLDEQALGDNPALQGELAHVIAEEQKRLKAYQSRFPPSKLANASVLLVDDGLATGATTEAAVLSARRQGARSVAVSAPVGSVNAVERLQRIAERVEVMLVDPDFDAVGRYYAQFPQTTDEEVAGLLVDS